MAGKGEEAYLAYRRGDPWTTRDGEAFVAAAPDVIAFLTSCGPSHYLSAGDLARARYAIEQALEFRRRDAHRAKAGQ